MDLSTIPAAFSSIKTATDIAKFILDSGTSLEKAESKMKIADLISALADAKIQISDIQQAMHEKDLLIRQLKDLADAQASLLWEDPYYWRINGDQRDGPFCQPCFDKEKTMSRLQANTPGHWQCRVCHQGFSEGGSLHTSSLRHNMEYDPFHES